MVAFPHAAQTTLVSTRARLDARFAMHFLQCLRSCSNCFSLKKICSPALKTNCSPHSTQVRVLSLNSIVLSRCSPRVVNLVAQVHSMQPHNLDLKCALQILHASPVNLP